MQCPMTQKWPAPWMATVQDPPTTAALRCRPPGAPCVTFRRVVVPLRGPGQSPGLPFACCVGSLLSVGRCGRCSCWCRNRIRGAQWFGVPGLCWMWRDVPFACQRRPIIGVLRVVLGLLPRDPHRPLRSPAGHPPVGAAGGGAVGVCPTQGPRRCTAAPGRAASGRGRGREGLTRSPGRWGCSGTRC